MRFMRVTRRLKRSADQKLSTVKPETSVDASKTRIALITIVNNPKVRMVIGNVNKIKSGFRKILKTPSTNATRSAVQKLATCTPGRTYEAIRITSVLANQLRSIPIFIQYNKQSPTKQIMAAVP